MVFGKGLREKRKSVKSGSVKGSIGKNGIMVRRLTGYMVTLRRKKVKRINGLWVKGSTGKWEGWKGKGSTGMRGYSGKG